MCVCRCLAVVIVLTKRAAAPIAGRPLLAEHQMAGWTRCSQSPEDHSGRQNEGRVQAKQPVTVML